MSLSYTETMVCPICGEEIEVCITPRDMSYDATCHECGFSMETVKKFMTLDELNFEREEIGLELLTSAELKGTRDGKEL